MANQLLNRPLWIVSIDHKLSKKHLEYYYIIQLISELDGDLVTTYVSDSNRNFKNWQTVIDKFMNERQAIRLQGLFPVKKTKKPTPTKIINADANFQVMGDTVDLDVFMNTVAETFYPEFV
jgi:hypothetical protein